MRTAKRTWLLALGLGLGVAFAADASKNRPLTAAESDPETMGWMKGFPPEKSKTLSAADGSFFVFPALRYSVNHMREFYPTREITASSRPYEFETALDDGIGKVKFHPWESAESCAPLKDEITWEEALDRNYTDGVIVLHKGKIVYEKYLAGLTQDGTHSAMSVSKSFAGTVGAILVSEGVIDDRKLVTDYIPELKGSGYEGATVRQIMDMTTAIKYSEDYKNPKAEVWAYSLAGNPFRPSSYKGPKNYYEYLKTLKQIRGQKHGEKFGYRTVNTEVLGWIISRATGKGMAELVSELLWKPLGARYNAYYIVDPAGIASAGGGISLNLRDMAAFGQMLLSNGKLGGVQVIPAAAAAAIAASGDPLLFEKSLEYPALKGWSYHDMWWHTNNSHGAYMARGVHGQAIYIDPAADMVIVRFASNPAASNKYIDPISIPAYEALAEYLMKK